MSVVTTILCDVPLCNANGPILPRSVNSGTKAQVKRAARRLGWSCGSKDLCPKHAKKGKK